MYSCTSKVRKLEESNTAVSAHILSHGTLFYPYQQCSRISMMLIVLVCASDHYGNNINPASNRKIFWRFWKVLRDKKFFNLARHRLDTYSVSQIHRRLRGVWSTLNYICYLFWTTWYSVFEPLVCDFIHASNLDWNWQPSDKSTILKHQIVSLVVFIWWLKII